VQQKQVLGYILRYACLAMLSLFAFRPLIVTQLSKPAPDEARLSEQWGMPVLTLAGTPYEMGLQHGQAFQQQLQQSVIHELYGGLFLENYTAHWALLRYAHALDRALPSPLRQEMKGVADGANLSYPDVLLSNVVLEMAYLAGQSPVLDASPSTLLGLGLGERNDVHVTYVMADKASVQGAAFAAWGDSVVGGALVMGCQYSMAAVDSRGEPLLILRKPDAGIASLTLGVPGSIGAWAGINAEQIAAVLVSAPSMDLGAAGEPLSFLVREALENADTLEDARDLALGRRRLYGGNLFLGDGKIPLAWVLEASAHRHELFEGERWGGVLSRGSSFMSAQMATLQEGILSQHLREAGQEHEDRLALWLRANSRWVSVEKLQGLLEDTCPGVAPADDFSLALLLVPEELGVWAVNPEVTSPGEARQMLSLGAMLDASH